MKNFIFISILSLFIISPIKSYSMISQFLASSNGEEIYELYKIHKSNLNKWQSDLKKETIIKNTLYTSSLWQIHTTYYNLNFSNARDDHSLTVGEFFNSFGQFLKDNPNIRNLNIDELYVIWLFKNEYATKKLKNYRGMHLTPVHFSAS